VPADRFLAECPITVLVDGKRPWRDSGGFTHPLGLPGTGSAGQNLFLAADVGSGAG
jgi:hypothetical protein